MSSRLLTLMRKRGAAFSPLSLNPTLLALPENSFSDNGVTPAVDNDPTYFVNDASTNDNDLTQVTLANRPLYKSAGYWTFDGVNDWIQAQSLFSMSGDITVSGFAVVKGTANADKSVLSFGAASLLNIFSLHTGVGAGNWSIEYGLNGYRTDAAIDLGWQIIAFIKTPGPINTTTRLYKNGVLASALSASTATPNISMSTSDHAFRIGVYNPATNFAAYNSSVAYVLIKENAAFSDEELNQLGNYLVAKYPSLSLSWTDIP